MTSNALSLLVLAAADPAAAASDGGHLLAYISAIAAAVTAAGGIIAGIATRGRGVVQGYKELDERRESWARELREDRDHEHDARVEVETQLAASQERVALLEAVLRHHVCPVAPHGIDPDVQTGPGRRGGIGGAT